ncbi:DUF4259 domain-containing protein [Streptomyces sp. NPDC017179]|uniref:DUF4259 domain-containing protein n=1 Tax=Streptomyces sp. NPDC017179 TaxID=3364979 RepID=UPI0037B9DD34
MEDSVGFWGSGPFENDEAMDLIDEINDESATVEERCEMLRRALVVASEPDSLLTVRDGASAVAAAAIVASNVASTDPLVGEFSEWVDVSVAVDSETVVLAIKALRAAVGSWSELLNLAIESKFEDELRESVNVILVALGATPISTPWL